MYDYRASEIKKEPKNNGKVRKIVTKFIALSEYIVCSNIEKQSGFIFLTLNKKKERKEK